MDNVDRAETKPSTILRNAYAVYPSFAMLAGMELDVFTPLDAGPQRLDALAKALDVFPAKLSPLLDALVAADLLMVSDGVFSNTAETGEFLVRGKKRYMGGLYGFYGKVWQAALHTAASIRSGKPQCRIDWQSMSEEKLGEYFESQFHSSSRAGEELAEKLDLSGYSRLLDAGGGSGGVAMALCRRYPGLTATVADMPTVVRLARRFLDEAGMSHSVATSATDLRAEPPEGGPYDVAIARALLQTVSRKQARDCLKNISRAMAPGGPIYIIGTFLENSRRAPLSSVGGGLVFLNCYDDGGAYAEEEYAEMLREAGFSEPTIEFEAFNDGLGRIIAHKL
jgi:hypothetical protein